MKKFIKRIAENIKRVNPDTAFIIIYTDKDHSNIKVKRVHIFITRSALSAEKIWDIAQRSILPPSSVSIGMRLKSARQRDITEKGSKNSEKK